MGTLDLWRNTGLLTQLEEGEGDCSSAETVLQAVIAGLQETASCSAARLYTLLAEQAGKERKTLYAKFMLLTRHIG